ncbi:MAG TPA: tRNA modification GTPase, partial [Gemmatimonadales bacterium]|nr:tRNA modification GTPase [Gemmatimonadales bacterium]
MLSDPIVALATPPGRSAVAVIRLSGDGAFAVAAEVIRNFRADPPREARLASFLDRDGAVLDKGLYLAFRGPKSETGEDMVEFHTHGGHLVPTRVLAAIEAAGARPAAAGEFTRRAVLNGKIDLIQAEAIGDLVEAESAAQGKAAIRQLDGGLSRRILALRTQLVELLALLSYSIDFPEEDDGPVDTSRIERVRQDVADAIARLLATAPMAERVRRGALVVLAGPPNAGKSSLFNALLGSDRALVTEIAGTTRDAIEAHADVLGWPVRLVDTAGLGETVDQIDALGQEMSRRYLAAADLVLLCDDTQMGPQMGPQIMQMAPISLDNDPRVLKVLTKSDLHPESSVKSVDSVDVSSLTGEGLDRLRTMIAQRLFADGVALADLEPALTRERHRIALGE